jgi:hypothetical protein
MLLRYGLSLLSVISTTVFSERFAGVDLWLPKVYQDQYMLMLDAAEKAKAAPYCHQLLSGRVVEDRSTIEHLYFHFRCRSDDKTMFSVSVDGKSLAVTNEYGEKRQIIETQQKAEEARLQAAAEKAAADEAEAERLRIEEEAEQVRIEEERRIAEEEAEKARLEAERIAEIQRQQSRYWSICRRAMKKRLASFENVVILAESIPEPIIEDEQFTYNVNFDADSQAKKSLHFKIVCTINGPKEYKVNITARKVDD